MESARQLIPEPPQMGVMQTGGDDISEYYENDDMTVTTMATMDDKTARKKYGLKNWRKYALYKHGNNPKFLNSTQGREILRKNFQNEVKQDIMKLTDWIDSVDQAASSMETELHATRAENEALVEKVTL